MSEKGLTFGLACQGQDYFRLDQKIEATRRETKKETDRLWEEIRILQDAFERLKNRKVG